MLRAEQALVLGERLPERFLGLLPAQQAHHRHAVDRTGDLAAGVSMRDPRREVGAGDQLRRRQVPPDQRDRQDPHQRAVAAVALARRTGVDGGDAGREPSQGRRCRPADVEQPVTIGRVGTIPLPIERATALVVRVEGGAATIVCVGQ